jgi:hypothetical protein
MNAKKLSLSLLALVLGLTFAGSAWASPDSAAATPPAGESPKACCKHHDSADGKNGAACDHTRAKGDAKAGAACCAHHGAAKKDGDKTDGCCCPEACEGHAGDKAAGKKDRTER